MSKLIEKRILITCTNIRGVDVLFWSSVFFFSNFSYFGRIFCNVFTEIHVIHTIYYNVNSSLDFLFEIAKYG